MSSSLNLFYSIGKFSELPLFYYADESHRLLKYNYLLRKEEILHTICYKICKKSRKFLKKIRENNRLKIDIGRTEKDEKYIIRKHNASNF